MLVIPSRGDDEVPHSRSLKPANEPACSISQREILRLERRLGSSIISAETRASSNRIFVRHVMGHMFAAANKPVARVRSAAFVDSLILLFRRLDLALTVIVASLRVVLGVSDLD